MRCGSGREENLRVVWRAGVQWFICRIRNKRRVLTEELVLNVSVFLFWTLVTGIYFFPSVFLCRRSTAVSLRRGRRGTAGTPTRVRVSVREVLSTQRSERRTFELHHCLNLTWKSIRGGVPQGRLLVLLLVLLETGHGLVSLSLWGADVLTWS